MNFTYDMQMHVAFFIQFDHKKFNFCAILCPKYLSSNVYVLATLISYIQCCGNNRIPKEEALIPKH